MFFIEELEHFFLSTLIQTASSRFNVSLFALKKVSNRSTSQERSHSVHVKIFIVVSSPKQ